MSYFTNPRKPRGFGYRPPPKPKRAKFKVGDSVESMLLTKASDGSHVGRGERGTVVEVASRTRFLVAWDRLATSGWYDGEVLSPVFADNPSVGPYVAGGAVALVLLAWVFWPKKAEAKPLACASAHDVNSFVAAKGLSVILLDGVPASSDVPPSGYNTLLGRVYSTVDCNFYRYLALDGAKSAWTVDAPLNAEFAKWRAL